ncbi:D-methionine transport system substrate-binding protein [Anaerovirgula multivorans]|uniref:D-methionine transport system substrate-binding protein n=1 Tax=Anaerovirgula multivorans TaxID=312168 RepID=A0A239C2R5_9FIRM|nr:MetQ/NlpA family ABC transporter substrate-binding protein [Anaerovirgula multivorans]SNS13958.1 D-methionine transport system substrate-binding protein [Anaerovirgula multivorans]
MKSAILKALCLTLVLVMSLSVIGCAKQEATTPSENPTEASTENPEVKGTIKLGALSTIEPFTSLLKDALIEKGYDAEVVLFDANNMPAIATKDGDIDGFIHNHLPWIETFNKENDSNLQMIEPYLGYYRTAIYSSKYKSIEEIPNNAIIAVPGDPTNIEKSLEMLEKLGLLTLGEKTENFYTILDIEDNPRNIKLLETEISATARSIDDADAVICPATRIRAAGIDPNSFLAEDMTTVDFPVGLTVAPNSVDKEWVKDAMEILESDEMRGKFDEIFQGTLVRYEKK